MEHTLLWDIAKTVVLFIIVPFCGWIMKENKEIKKEISTMKEEVLKFKADVAQTYAPKQDIAAFMSQIDLKFNNMQSSITQRIDTMQNNIANMISSLGK